MFSPRQYRVCDSVPGGETSQANECQRRKKRKKKRTKKREQKKKEKFQPRRSLLSFASHSFVLLIILL
jgi:hypothetical protein